MSSLRQARALLNKIALQTFARHADAFREIIAESPDQLEAIIDLIGCHAVQGKGQFFALFAALISDLARYSPEFHAAVTVRVDYELRIGLDGDDPTRFLAVVDFIAHLALDDTVSRQRLKSFIDSAFMHDNATAVEAAYRVLLVLKGKDEKMFSGSFEQLARAWKPSFPNRLRFLILDLLELRDRDWIPRREPDLPPMMPLDQFRRCLRQTNG